VINDCEVIIKDLKISINQIFGILLLIKSRFYHRTQQPFFVFLLSLLPATPKGHHSNSNHTNSHNNTDNYKHCIVVRDRLTKLTRSIQFIVANAGDASILVEEAVGAGRLAF